METYSKISLKMLSQPQRWLQRRRLLTTGGSRHPISFQRCLPKATLTPSRCQSVPYLLKSGGKSCQQAHYQTLKAHTESFRYYSSLSCVKDKEDNRRAIPVNPGSFAATESWMKESQEKESIAGSRRSTRKAKVAVLLGYVGKNYAGLQMNPHPHLPTVQAVLERAIFECGQISLQNYGCPAKIHWRNGARTDRGVHACGLVVSFKVALERSWEDDGECPYERLRIMWNEKLPDDVAVLDVVPTSRNFDARVERDRARYVYLVPSFVLDVQVAKHFMEWIKRRAPSLSSLLRGEKEDLEIESPSKKHTITWTDDQLAELRAYKETGALQSHRIAPASVTALQSVLQTFVGTHQFHNYTIIGKLKMPKAKSSFADVCSRYILAASAENSLYASDNTEWIPIQITGQSFLYNQIRKMVGMVTCVTTGRETNDQFIRSFDSGTKRNVVTAPAQGLFLDMSFYGSYNRKMRMENSHPVEKDRALLDWADSDDSDGYDVSMLNEGSLRSSKAGSERLRRFREEVIVPHILEEENAELNFLKFLVTLEFDRVHQKGGETD